MSVPVTDAVIVSASLAAGHDGLAELAIDLRYPNGAQRVINLPYETIAAALDAAGITSPSELVGQPWTILTVQPEGA
jgi:hypothetical protein